MTRENKSTRKFISLRYIDLFQILTQIKLGITKQRAGNVKEIL